MSTDIFLEVSSAILIFLVLGSVSAWIATRPLYAAWLVLGMVIVDAAKIEPIAFDFGILLYPEDLLFLVLSISCLIRVGLMSGLKTVPRSWWIIGAVQFSLFIWGLATFGKAAGVDYRIHFYVWVAVVYFSSFNWTEGLINRVANAWILCAVCLCMVVYYRWIASAVDPVFAQKMMDLDTTGVRFRVIGSAPALVIAVGFLILFFRSIMLKLSLGQRLLLPMFLLTIVVLQHRSVWVSLFVGIMCLLWTLQRKKYGRKTIIGVALMIIPLALFFVIQDKNSGVLASVMNSADQAVSTEEGTMVGRINNWDELLTKWVDSKNPTTYLIGKPYGSGYNPVASEDGKLTFDMVPHNHFVHVLYRGGLIGLAATLYIFYQLWANGIKFLKAGDKRWTPYFLAVFAAFLSYYIPYWANYGHGLLIGIAISYFEIARAKMPYRYPGAFEQRSLKTGGF
ncbi:MAG: hypothetical protein JWQ21_1844 [Herminiimonas sp.]|nr:hypothetical protein [Herminiimonas sp.]